jgi:hypothetical protein
MSSQFVKRASASAAVLGAGSTDHLVNAIRIESAKKGSQKGNEELLNYVQSLWGMNMNDKKRLSKIKEDWALLAKEVAKLTPHCQNGSFDKEHDRPHKCYRRAKHM